jgi:hypothetical protein
MEARVRLLNTELKKSGLNKFAGYSYFELGDFIPAIQKIFHDLGLCGVVSYKSDYAELSIVDIDDGTVITITSPMADANLKGTHPIQNLGAVETYQRRYLWMTAMEIVEHDAIDSSSGTEIKKTTESSSSPETKKSSGVVPPPAFRPPSVIVGADGEWQMKVSISPGADVKDWLSIIDEAVVLMIGQTHSQKDVKQIFLKNKQLFEAVKTADAVFFKELMAKLSEALKKFPEAV